MNPVYDDREAVMPKKHTLAFCRIFPPIGIARLGNSPDEFFVGPEVPGQAGAPEGGLYKDPGGRVRRQAARFRVYGYDKDGYIREELDASSAKIEWQVELANKKAQWHRFEGTDEVARVLGRDVDVRVPALRNADLEGGKREGLCIGPISGTVSGKNKTSNSLEGRFLDYDDPVSLGVLRTDENGHLLVLGGHGAAGTTLPDNPVRDYSNNDRWFDDTSDGPVTARVSIGGKEIPVESSAWVIVAPPDYSPHTPNIVTAYDALVQTALDHNLDWSEQDLGPRPEAKPKRGDFSEYVEPLLRRASLLQWISDKALRGHGSGRRGNLDAPDLLKRLADPKVAAEPESPQKRIFSRVRNPLIHALHPSTREPDKVVLDPKSQQAKNQANLYFMPPLSGDQGDATHENPKSWLTVTELQYRHLWLWSDGAFDAPEPRSRGKENTSVDIGRLKVGERPAALTRAALEAAQGGAFYPGIEITSIARDAGHFESAFRLSSQLEPGDVTKWMAVPWQADFHACSDNWWPTARPDDVIPEHEFRLALEEFSAEAQQGSIASTLNLRSRWDRGLGETLPPKPNLPPPRDEKTLDEYREDVLRRLKWMADRYLASPVFRVGGERLAQVLRDRLQAHLNRTLLSRRNLALPNPETNESVATYRARVLAVVEWFLDQAIEGVPTPEPAEPLRAYADRVLTYAADSSVLQGLLNTEWRVRQRHRGKNDMIREWHRLGFVVPITTKANETIYVEAERRRYDLLRFRDHFHILMNINDHPDYRETAIELAEEYLRLGRELYSEFQTTPSLHQYAPFEYSPVAFDSRLHKIYEIERRKAERFNPASGEGTIFNSPAQLRQRILQLAPFNQLDGSWLRRVVPAGPIDEVKARLFEIWMDEMGNGDPAQNHANIYGDLLHAANIYLPPITSLEYAQHPDLHNESYSSPAYQHAIAEFPERYFPELLGMTLYLEWEAVYLQAMVKLYNYHGYPSIFYDLHVAIDNPIQGHAGKALEAVKLYLDHVRAESGEPEMQQHWRRIWNGYISFKFVGSDAWSYRFANPQSPAARMIELVQRKRQYAQFNHGRKRLDANLINDWFDLPWDFLKVLAESDWIVKGHPQSSRIFDLTGPFGKMVKVFSQSEIQVIKDWIQSLPTEGDGSSLSPGDAMAVLLRQMRAVGIAEPEHVSHALGDPRQKDQKGRFKVAYPISWWFQVGDPAHYMEALADPDNGWIVPGDPESSRFVNELVVDQGRMARALVRVLPEAGGATGREIVYDWIKAGCPAPGTPPEAPTANRCLPVTEKLSPEYEQQRREEYVGDSPLIAETVMQLAEIVRRRQLGPGGGACH